MTNTIYTNIIVSVASSSQHETLFQRYSGEIFVAILIGAGALLWKIFVTPHIEAWQKNRKSEQRKKELIDSFSDMTISAGVESGKNRCFVSITIPNRTNKSVIVREVALLPDAGGSLGMFHDVSKTYLSQRTSKTETGIEIKPYSEAIWYFDGEIREENLLIIKRCKIEFEYEKGSGETEVYEMISPQNKEQIMKEECLMWQRIIQNKINK